MNPMMLLKITLLVSLLSLLFITGCSSRSDIKITEVFRSSIATNNAKLFTFSIVFVRSTESKSAEIEERSLEENHKQTRQGKGRGKKSNTENKPTQQHPNKKQQQQQQQQNNMIDELETRLADRLADNNYCRKGFFELKRSLNKTIFTIHGECNESATTADNKNFPQVQHLDVR